MQPADHVERAASRSPHALAVVGTAAEISYAQLAEHASRIATLLRERGVQPGHVVAVALPAQLEVILIQSVFLLAGISCHLPSGQRAGVEVDWLVGLEPDVEIPAERTILVDAAWLRRANDAERFAGVPFDGPDSVARLIFSSGTTGTPKAVPMTIENLEYRAAVAPTHWMARPPVLCLLGLATASGTTAYFTAISRGEAYIIPATATENLALMAKHRVASIKGSPAQLDALATAFEAAPIALPSLALIQSVGSVLSEPLAARLGRVFGVEVANLYGSSESGVVSIRRGESLDPMDAGTVVDDMTVEIVDASDSPLPPGDVGVIRTRRPTQAAGYFRDGAAGHFRDGWFYPGDLGSLDADGRLTLAGREAELINAGGIKVDPARIDAAAAGFPGLEDAAAFAAVDSGVTRIGLAIVGEVDIAALVAHLQRSLGTAAPRAIVRVASIPRTETGKARRAEIAASAPRILR